MTDPVEVIARAICETRFACRVEHCLTTRRREHAHGFARAALAALEGEGFRVFSIVPVKREPEPLVFEDD
jgi:hypothetical protein